MGYSSQHAFIYPWFTTKRAQNWAKIWFCQFLFVGSICKFYFRRLRDFNKISNESKNIQTECLGYRKCQVEGDV